MAILLYGKFLFFVHSCPFLKYITQYYDEYAGHDEIGVTGIPSYFDTLQVASFYKGSYNPLFECKIKWCQHDHHANYIQSSNIFTLEGFLFRYGLHDSGKNKEPENQGGVIKIIEQNEQVSGRFHTAFFEH